MSTAGHSVSLGVLAGGDSSTNCLLQRSPQHPLMVPQAPLLPIFTSAVLILLSGDVCLTKARTPTHRTNLEQEKLHLFFSKMRSQYPKSIFQMQLQGLHNWNFFSNLITSFRQFLTSGDYKWEFVVNIAKKKVPLMFLQCIQSSLGMSRENSFLFHLKCHYVH